MRKISIAAATFVALAAFTTPALAATLLTANGTPLSQKIKNNHGVDNNDTTLTFSSDPANYLVNYASSDTLHYNGNSGGFAEVTGLNGTGFSDLTITPVSPITFTAFKFKLELPASEDGPDIPGGYHTAFTFDTKVFFSGGGSQDFTVTGGADRYIITAGLNQFIDKIVFSDLVGVSTKSGKTTLTNDFNFDAIKQASFNAISSVPEPATWAEFILGFGAIGVALRRRRSQAAAVPA